MKTMLTRDIDISMITETKLDDSFPVSQFEIDGFSIPFRLDRNKNAVGILLYIRSYIVASKLSNYIYPNDIEAFFIEINIKGNKWLICCSYNPNRLFVSGHLDHIAKGIDTYSKKYEKILLMGDFSIELKEANMTTFWNQYKLKTLNEEPTCFKNYTNPSCIDLYLTNCPKGFQSTLTIETGLSDFHKLIITVLKVKHEKVPPKVIHYRDHKNFDLSKFFEKLQLKPSNLDMRSLDFGSLKICFMELLNKIAPLKNKFLRANHSNFVTKEVSKAIMLRTKLRNKFLKKKTLESRAKNNKQRNICVSLIKKAKRNYYENLDLKDINDNKKFWATVKPFFSNKIKSAENIYLDESGEIIRNEKEVANVFNKYFVNIVPNIIGLTNNHNLLSDTGTTNDPIEKIINKYQNHPSITSINKHMTRSELTFLFQTGTKEQITNLIRLLNNKKAIQSTDIPTKLIKYIGFSFLILYTKASIFV